MSCACTHLVHRMLLQHQTSRNCCTPCAVLPTFYCWKRNDTFLSNYLVSPEPRGLLGLIWQLPRLIIWWRRQSLALQFKHSADVICNKPTHCKLPLCCVWTVWLSRWESLSYNLRVSSSLWICSYDSSVSMTVAGGIMFQACPSVLANNVITTNSYICSSTFTWTEGAAC